MNKFEEEVDRHYNSIVEQIRCNNAFRYPEPKWVPFKNRTLINKIKSIYYSIRYFYLPWYKIY